jgi:6-phosphogluconolactonase
MMTASNPQTMVYVSNAGSKDIFVLAMDRASGMLELVEKTPVPGTDKPSPTSLPMTTSRDGRFLYAQLRTAPYPVSTFAIVRPSGKLRHIAATPLVDQMTYINTDHQGRYLLAASYPGAKLAIYPIDPASGIPGAEATQILDTKPKAHCVYVGAGNNIYVPVLGGDEVLELTLDPKTGTVSPNGPGKVDTKPNAGPRHFTIHPNGRWAYLITEITATIATYAIDPATGQLSEVAFVDIGEYNGTDSAAASDIHVTPNGKFLYGVVRRTNTLHGYKIDPGNGTLSPIGRFATEKKARAFNIDPRGKFLLSVGMESNAMTVYAIDPGSGALDPIGHHPMGIQPNWVEIVDLH